MIAAETSLHAFPDRFEGKHFSTRHQWWCLHGHLVGASGLEVGFYYWPTMGSMDEAWIASLHTENDGAVDFTVLHLPPGSIQASKDGVDVSYEGFSFRGEFPTYKIEMDRQADDRRWVLNLTLTARTSAFEAFSEVGGIDWYYVPRLDITGSMSIDGVAEQVAGSGYYERRRGPFWAPNLLGSVWESVPDTGVPGLSIPLFNHVWRSDGSVQHDALTIVRDDRIIALSGIDVQFGRAVELTGPDGSPLIQPLEMSISVSNDQVRADLNVIRDDRRIVLRDYFAHPYANARALGSYGPSRVTGTISVDGATYKVDGPGYGSALAFREGPAPAID